MKIAFFIAVLCSSVFAHAQTSLTLDDPSATGQPAAPAATTTQAACDDNELRTIYVPKFSEVAEWPVEQLMDSAKDLCAYTQVTNAAVQRLKARVAASKNDAHTCTLGLNVSPGAACAKAYAAKINKLVDQCSAVMLIGRDPHNVGIVLTDAFLEGTCATAVADTLDKTKLSEE